MSEAEPPAYLKPYLAAARRYGAGFGSLLWASPRTQAARFDTLVRAATGRAIRGHRVLDVGCGRADLLDHLRRRDVRPASYVGIEAVDELATAAEQKGATIVRGDFVRQPELLRAAGADVVLVSGALNTMDAESFYRCVTAAFEAAGNVLAFNFLAGPTLAAADHLTWHRPADVRAFAASLSHDVGFWDDYLPGDATVAVRKANAER